MPIFRLQKYNKIIPYEPVLHWTERHRRRKKYAETYLRNCIKIWMERELIWLQQIFFHWKQVSEMLITREVNRSINNTYCSISDDEIYKVNRIFNKIAEIKKEKF